MKRILYLGLLLATLCGGVAAQNPQGQTRIAKEERTRYVEDSLLSARMSDSIGKLRDSLRLMATKTYVIENYVSNTDSRLTDSRTPKGTAGGDLTGTYPNPTIKSSVALTGSPTAPTPATTTNSTRIATTAYVKSNLSNYVPTTDSRLSDSRTPTGTAGGDLTGTYPNPTIKSSVTLSGNPTVSGNLTVNGTATFKGVMKKRTSYLDIRYDKNITISPGETFFLDSHTGYKVTIKYPSENELNHNNVARILIKDDYIENFITESSYMTIYKSTHSNTCQECATLYEIYWITRNVVVVEYRSLE